MAEFYLGVDGGQSSTTALIADESGRVLGSGKGGPCNHVATSEGRAKFFSAVGACVSQACEAAGLERNDLIFASVCLGFSGGAQDKEAYTRELIPSRRYKITHDAEIALAGATAGQPGVIIIAGTGSMAFGRNAAGKTGRAGGWGYLFGDEGGAFDLVRRAMRASLEEEEGWGEPTVLKNLLLQTTGAPDVNTLLHWLYTAEYNRTKIASFAPLVTEAAATGDHKAQIILHHAAAELATYTEGAYRHLFPQNEQVPVAYVGGAFLSVPLLQQYRNLIRQKICCEVGPPKLQPVAGALLEALRLDNNPNDLYGLAEPS